MMYNISEVRNMRSNQGNHSAVAEALWAKSIGREALDFIKSRGVSMEQSVHDEAVILLEKIRAILDDNTLDDPQCFHRIEAIVDAFSDADIPTARHDW